MSTATITAREANQQFAKVLREVAQGKEFVVTMRGRPVARITPAAEDGTRVPTPEQEAAWQRILLTKWHLNSRDEPFDRDSLHERR
jgi:prevent-host-death family protein